MSSLAPALWRLLEMAPTMRAVFLSGYPVQPSGDEEVDLGGRPLLHKPVEAAALLRTLRQILDA